MIAAAVSLAGAGGAVTRYVVDGWVQQRSDAVLPLGTLVVNATGSLLLGLLVGWAIAHGADADVTLIAGTGFLGGYTTFSTYAYESFRLAEDGSGAFAALNVVASLCVGLVAAVVGLAVTGAL